MYFTSLEYLLIITSKLSVIFSIIVFLQDAKFVMKFIIIDLNILLG